MDKGSLLIGPLGRPAEAGKHQTEQGERTPKVPEGSPGSKHRICQPQISSRSSFPF